MPVEIKELIIKATVTGSPEQESDQTAHTTGQKNEIIRLCVEEVLRILARNKER